MQTIRYSALLFIIAGAMLSGQSAAADGARELARNSGCFNCHTIEVDDTGPAWRNVAVKYRGNTNAEAILVNKVTKGGKGVWGYLPMPSFAAKLSEAEIRTLVKYILALK